MQITVDNTTLGSELYHLSILFQSLAKARGFEVPRVSSKTDELSFKLNIDTADATAALEKMASRTQVTQTQTVGDVSMTLEVETSDPAVALAAVATNTTPVVGVDGEMIGTVNLDKPDSVEPVEGTDHVSVGYAITPPPTTNPNLDADGLPWDARIHSGSRALNVDGTWRTARRPKAMNEDEWQATLTRVNAELRELMEIPVSTGADVDAFAELVADLTPPPVVVAPPVNIVPPPVTEKVDVDTGEITIVPPPVTAAKPAIETFPQVMVWLTSHTPKDETEKQAFVARVNEILATNKLTVLTQLGQRADLIPQVMSQFIEAFGE